VKNAVLITGGDGYLGQRTAQRYLESTDHPVWLWVRAKDRQELVAKQARLDESLKRYTGRVTYFAGDLTAPEPFAAVDPKAVGQILHCAAITRFNVDEESARRTNVEGTRQLLDLAARCPSLDVVSLVSTAYASGLRPGVIEEARLTGEAGFANHYERSKWTAEELLFDRYAHLPWQVFRMATVIADDVDGRLTQFNAVHNTLKLFYYGLLSFVPGLADTPLYFVTGDLMAAALFELMQHGEVESIYHLAHRKDECLRLGELIDLAYDSFSADPGFKTRRVLKPLFSDAESFDLLVEGVRSFGGGVVNQALSSVAPFARQLFVHKDLRNARTAADCQGFRSPDIRRVMQNTCAQLVATRWGRAEAERLAS
jgi:nucleoside-diphosphate-sugar epimerase